MWTDPIVEEIHREREAYAATFNHDLAAIFEDIKRQERESGREYVTLPPKPFEAQIKTEGKSQQRAGRRPRKIKEQ